MTTHSEPVPAPQDSVQTERRSRADASSTFGDWLDSSPRQVAQRQKLADTFGTAAPKTSVIQRVKNLLRGQHVTVDGAQSGIVLGATGAPGHETAYRIFDKATRIVAEIAEARVASDADAPAHGMTAEQAEALLAAAPGDAPAPAAVVAEALPVAPAAPALQQAAPEPLVAAAQQIVPVVGHQALGPVAAVLENAAMPEPARIAKAKAYLSALSHIRLVPIFERSSATDFAGMGHLSASRQSVDNLLLLGFRGTIELVYTNNGYNEEAIQDLFPVFPQGGAFTGPGGERANIAYIPKDGPTGIRRLTEAQDVTNAHAKNRERHPERTVALINNWDVGYPPEPSLIPALIRGTRAAVPEKDMNPGDARHTVNLQAFGWAMMGQRFVYDSLTDSGQDLVLPEDSLAGYLRAPYPNPIKDAAQRGPEHISGAVDAFMNAHPILKNNNTPMQVIVSGLGNRSLVIECHHGTTGAQLKQLITEKSGLPVRVQALRHNNKPLPDDKTLYDAGVSNQETIRGSTLLRPDDEDPDVAASPSVAEAPEGKTVDIHTTRTLSCILENTAKGLWDFLPGYGFHNASEQSLDRVALAASKAQTTMNRHKPIVFLSMRHTRVPSKKIRNLSFKHIKADAPNATEELGTIRPDQVAVVVASGVPGPLFNQLALSATLPIALEGAGTASFAIEQGIPYFSLRDNPSLVKTGAFAPVGNRLEAIGIGLSRPAAPATLAGAAAETANIDELAAIIAASTRAESDVAKYYRDLQTEARKPEHHQMAAAFEVLYNQAPRTVTLRRAATQINPAPANETLRFEVEFRKTPRAFVNANLTLTPTGTVNLAAAVTTIGPMQASPTGAANYPVTITGVTGTGTVSASIANGVVHDLGAQAFPASVSDAGANTITIQ